MKLRTFTKLCTTLVLVAFASMALHCDRGIEPFDPDEEPVSPNLARIYPEGSKGTAGPPGAGMPSAQPAAQLDSRQGDTRQRTAQPASSDAGDTISGVIEIGDAIDDSRPADAMLFIIARSQPTGPPLAVLRVPSASFPHSFEIGQAQVMIPTLKFAGQVRLSARLDSDGNAMTKLPGDLVGEVAIPLLPGASGVVLVLDQKL
jgi:hypothetical protein